MSDRSAKDSSTASVAASEAITLRPARPDEAERLSALTLRSKAHWGYDDDFMAKSTPYLQITPAMIEHPDLECVVAQQVDSLLGYSLLYKPADPETDAVLENLFVDPPAIGQGAGGLLLKQVLATAKAAGYAALFVEADPNAEAFYLKYGAVRVGERESGVQARRWLPWLRFDLR